MCFTRSVGQSVSSGLGSTSLAAFASRPRLPLAIATVLVLAAAVTALARPPAADAAPYKSYPVFVSNARPVVHQWWTGLEDWFNQHLLIEPQASNTENAAEVQQLLHQWWVVMENRRGLHFLLEPLAANTDTTAELHQLLNQWENAIEAWRGISFLPSPPSPFVSFTPTKTGVSKLTPKRSAVAAGNRFSQAVGWTVPRPNNWHDLKTIDLRVCGRGGVLWVRWTELRNTLSLLNPRTGQVTAKGRVGVQRRLSSRAATLNLRASSVSGNGETGRNMTLDLSLRFRSPAKDRDCGIEVAASDDLGNRDGFKRAGRIRIKP